MAVAPPANPWGKPSDRLIAKNKGFFNLDSEGSKSPSTSRSFKEVLEGASSGDIFPNVQQSVFNGIPAVLLSDEEVLKLASPFQFTLVGKFGVRRPNLDVIRNFFSSLKLTGFYSVGLLDTRHAAIQLSNDLDYNRVFARCSYFIYNCQMRILKWTPFFDIKEESPIVPVWISFPNIRLHFFNSKVLHALGSIFGRPLQTDQATAARTCPSVVRVLVEVDISKKHPKEIWVGSKAYGYLQKAEFEKVPEFCIHCQIYGHAQVDCFKLNPELKKHAVQASGRLGLAENKQIYVPIVHNNEGNDTHVEPPPSSQLAQVENVNDSMEFVEEIGHVGEGEHDMSVGVLNVKNDVVLDSNINDFDQLEKNGADVSNEPYEEAEFVPPSNLNAKSPTKQGFLSSFLIRARLSASFELLPLCPHEASRSLTVALSLSRVSGAPLSREKKKSKADADL
ncbi:hypothetical protein KFK09_007274 [Dendrobium nobile]|uniref:DUF4283 domain-containing protein n=1 Tax=Dendrobium nobile TaxID=94219 RepID=A0A8T3BWD6_DENNO|nr:hypothetical protein KFK09_007274 [Dendrobium nobile]